jgi:DNA-binding NtrC family response regulator
MNRKGRVFLVDDDELIISMLARALRKDGYETQLLHSSENAVEKISAWQPHILLLDVDLGLGPSGLDLLETLVEGGVEFPIVMLTADDSAESAIRAMKAGAADYLNKPFNIEEVKIVLENLLAHSRMKNELDYLKKKRGVYLGKQYLGESAPIKAILNNAQKMAAAGVPSILITGKSGTGKEVMALNIHYWHFGAQPNFEAVPYIAVNCSALPENLIEGELFGHVKGAFTDAKTDKKGLFELADGGTLLLDEIGDMRLDLQSKLLRVLEERSVRRIGGRVDQAVDVSVIACTNRDLKKLVADGEFREDLYYRLSSFSLHLPPLSERPGDVEILTRYYLDNLTQKYAKKQIENISPEALALLNNYSWPGNIRELKNVLERCVVLENIQTLTTEHLPIDMGGREKSAGERRKRFQIFLPEEGISLQEVEKELMRLALERAGSNMTKAAKLLQVSYDTFRYQAKKYDLQ